MTRILIRAQKNKNLIPKERKKRSTLPAVVTDAQLLPCKVTVAVVGASTVVPAVGDVTGLAFPVLVALAVDSADGRVTRRALAVSRAVIWTRIHAGKKKK